MEEAAQETRPYLLMNQILLGATPPFLIAAVIYVARRRRASLCMLVAAPIAMLLSSVWAVVPDIPRLLGMSDLYVRLARDSRCNIFWWHYSIDNAETDSRWYAVGIVLMAAAMLYVAWRELALLERCNTDAQGTE